MTLDFLNTDEKVKLPVGGDFVSGSIIGGWYAVVTTSFMSETDLGTIEEAPKPDYVFKSGPTYLHYHYKDDAAGKRAAEVAGQQYPPKQSWLWLCEKAKVLSMTEEDLTKWPNDPLNFKVAISTLKSVEHRHEEHMIALPSAVAAMATAYGFDNPGFDLSELTSQNTLFTPEFQDKMIGVGKDFVNSVLWQRRAALWQALGESDPTKSEPKFVYVNGKQVPNESKLATQSDKLGQCLGILAFTWKTGIWARLVQVNSPVEKAVSKQGNRLTVPALTEIFENKTAAKKVADEELEARKKAKENGNGNHASEKKVPSGIPSEEWTKYVEDVQTAIAGMSTLNASLWMKKEVPADLLESVKAWIS